MATVHISRHATRLSDEADHETRLLSDWRSLDAYVLLGDPGAGKSCAFEDESGATAGLLLKARDVVDGIAQSAQGRTVFIDGLDEVRAGAADGRVPIGRIRKWLFDQGCPRFRLSCREADWLGSGDRRSFEDVAPQRKVAELHLEPLRDEEIAAVVAGWAGKVPDPDAFVAAAVRNGLKELLRNPLLLRLAIEAASGDEQPRTRAGLYDAACRQLARETNEEHLAATPLSLAVVERLLDDAGLLCALMLLSGSRGIANPGTTATPGAVPLADLPLKFKLDSASSALKTKVFAAEGGMLVPRHRTIAEFLAARALARRIDAGLPVGRVLALMQGADGFPVESLRGLWGWLATTYAPSRSRLIDIDPVGVVLNGDVGSLVPQDRIQVLLALREAAERDPWLRGAAWVSHPFGPLATADMAPIYENLLRDPRRGRGHLAFIDCALDALRHGEPMPALGPALASWVEDGEVTSDLRIAAYEAWKRSAGFQVATAMRWLRSVQAGSLVDKDDELCGSLLEDLYPEPLPPTAVFEHWHAPKQRSLLGTYHMFWAERLWAQTPPSGFATLAEDWLRREAPERRDPSDDDAPEIASRLLAMTLRHAGDSASEQTLYEWLGLGLDKYGSSRLHRDADAIRAWLSQRPQRMKAVVAIGFARARQGDGDRRRQFWQAEARLHGAKRPRDWMFWLLDQAASAEAPDLAEYCFFPAARAAIEPVADFDNPTMTDVEAWVERNRARWPQAVRWLGDAWSTPIDDWKGEQAQRHRQAQALEQQKAEARRRDLQAHLPTLLDGSAPAGLLYQLALAHDHGFSDLRGNTPLERVAKYLVVDEPLARAVIDALPKVLLRDDLPSVDAVIALEAQGKHYYLQSPALLAARLASEREPAAPLGWPRGLAERLVAYSLSDIGNLPAWYRTLVEHRPDWLAPILVRCTRPKLRRKGQQVLNGLWPLAREEDHAALARLALPELLHSFPQRASEPARSTLNRDLLPGLALLARDRAATLVREKLSQSAMDPGQRICWLVADLPYRPEAAEDLAEWVGRNERRAVLLGAALHEQGTLTRVTQRLEPKALRHLAEVLAPITQPERTLHDRVGTVTPADHRRDTVEEIFAKLSSDPTAEARQALLEAARAPGLGGWEVTIQYYLRAQAAAAREANFRVPTAAEVALVLANSAPAGPADLRALVAQHLDDLQAQWRGRDTFALKIFWDGATGKPKSENDCRDLLLDRLRERLRPLDIVVDREQSAARDKRSDMCAQFMRDGRRVALPIEVKKEDHAALWTAWRDQLQRLYTVEPDCGGFGLYLVLWFGQGTARHPEGLKPRGREELQHALEARIPQDDRHRLAVKVLDLAWPAED